MAKKIVGQLKLQTPRKRSATRVFMCLSDVREPGRLSLFRKIIDAVETHLKVFALRTNVVSIGGFAHVYRTDWFKPPARRSLVKGAKMITDDQIAKLPPAEVRADPDGASFSAEGVPTARVVSITEQRQKAARRTGRGDGDAHYLQLRLPPAVYNVFLSLKDRAEADTMGELIRLALREYERAFFEFDAIEHANDKGAEHDAGDPDGSGVKCVSRTIDPQRRGHGAQGAISSKRLNVPLNAAAYARLQRLMRLTDAESQAEVVRTALCVLDAKLDEYDTIVGRPEAARSGSRLISVK